MKPIKLLVSCLATLMYLSGCDSTNVNIEKKIIRFSQENQQFTIVPFYLKMPAYVKKAKENRNRIDQIYKSYVYDPIFDDFASKGECSFLAKNIKYPITDLDGLNNEIQLLSQSAAEEIVKQALLKVSKVLPGPNTTIYLQVIDPAYKKIIPASALKVLNMGMRADTYGSGKILIAIDPTAENWQNMLPRVVAHEYHHSVWIYRNFETIHFSLLDCLILEGRAEGFAGLLYPGIEAPWPAFFNRAKEYNVWLQMKSNLYSKDEHIIMKMFAGDKEIPFLSVYSMGYRIMQEFLKNNSAISLLQWTDMQPAEILSLSKYEESFTENYN